MDGHIASRHIVIGLTGESWVHFTTLGTVAAWLAFAFGAARVGVGLYVASNMKVTDFDPLRYIGSATSGQAIDQGIVVILCAIALGILAEISRSVRPKG